MASVKPNNPGNLRIAVIQDGARLHYAVPLALERAGALALMFSEWFVKRGVLGGLLRCIPRAGERRCDEIAPAKVRINPWLTLAIRRGRPRFQSDEAFYAWASSEVGKWVRRKGLGEANGLFGFVRNIDPELCKWAKESGRFVLGDQIIAPAAIEAEEAAIQAQQWPNWEVGSKHDWKIVQGVEEQTWQSLDRVTCASEYVRNGLQKQGVAADKITVCPYPIDATKYSMPRRAGRTGPITVGFVGAVGLRKGAPYFCQVARRLASEQLKFVMVGPVQIDAKVTSTYSDCVQFVGRVSRSDVANWMEKFDIYLFPSTCEGSAGSAMEAMACGLPVVASPNAGTIIRDGADGFLLEYSDIEGLAASVHRLATDEQLRLSMGSAARKSAEAMNMEYYGQRLLEVFHSAMAL